MKFIQMQSTDIDERPMKVGAYLPENIILYRIRPETAADK